MQKWSIWRGKERHVTFRWEQRKRHSYNDVEERKVGQNQDREKDRQKGDYREKVYEIPAWNFPPKENKISSENGLFVQQVNSEVEQ